MLIAVFVYAFIAIFLLNLIPVFGPPTWMVLSFIAFTYPIPSIPLFIFVAICGSVSGRSVLTLSSKYIIRNRLLSDKYRRNVDHLREHIEKKPLAASGIFLAEAFTPLPSDQLFIAYGLTGLKLRYALIPFAIGRIFTYSFWVYGATEVSKRVAVDSLTSLSFFSGSFVLVEFLLLFLVYFFVKIDWEHLILHHRFRIFH
jgi:hypothetical protein